MKDKKHLWRIILGIIFFLQLMTIIYFGSRKQGFHEDEYYSFYSTNRTAGLFEPDRKWVERDTFRNEFVVLEGEEFNYGLVSTVQSWDVHPPFFYFILHTACSLFPGIFSKWLGIGINIIAFSLNFVLLSWLSYMITNKNRLLTLLVAAVYGFNAANLSGVMFIRMYEWLTVFVLLCACLHVRAITQEKNGFKNFLLPLMAVTCLGFLTQYYYIIFLVFMAAGYGIWLLAREKKLWGCMRYGASCAAALALAVISYPSCLSHIFRGYRGTGAASEFLDAANTGGRLRFFGGLVNEYLFDGGLWLWLLVIAAFAVLLLWKKAWKINGNLPQNSKTAYLLLLFAVGGYFFTVSKTALLLYETSNRYQLPVYGMIQLLVISALYYSGRETADTFGWKIGIRKIGMVFLTGGLLLGGLHGLISGKVVFLYEEEREQLQFAKENKDQTVVVFYNDATPYHVWWCAQELMEYDRVYFASEADKSRIEDTQINASDKVIVYAADYDTKEESLNMLLESSKKLEKYRLIAKKSLWSVYEFD